MDTKLEQEFIVLLEGNQNILHKICKLYTVDLASHQDLFQEMVIQLWKSYPKFKGDSKFSTWAYRVSLNTAISLYRTKKSKITTVDWDNSLANIRYEEYNSEEEERLKFLYDAVRQLNDIDKALVYMYLEDKDYTEIAETLGISEVNARVKMNRIKNKIKEMVAKQSVA
ncbi:RNA polymerase sigma factor [Sphingobacterium humi]|uniref:Sigma-70 family RNA polymerase sigma factor n=1 Tax=Sphingobacterium humi TaxID=1796905 RepID=A0A6N8KWL5_9SPHI|nr:sigma-70 family RNA polymerase sigma factor [Sphingobacterium humi]MVZ61843.1 sigma-70 family RNA polymerase sigma factor [Sphingobacterium humi]